MKLMDILKLSLNSLTHRGLRSWLTILGIIIGVAAVVAMLSIGEGMTSSVESQMSGLGADICTVSPGYTQAEGSMGGFGGREPPQMSGGRFGDFGGQVEDDSDDPTLTDVDISTISSVNGVVAINGVVSGRGEVKYLAETVSVTIEGIDPIAWKQMTTSELEAGRFLNEAEGTSVVIGSGVSTMFEQNLTIDTQIKIEGRTFLLVGILGESGTGGFGGDDRTVFMIHESANSILDDVVSGEYSSIEFKVSNADYINQIMEDVEDALLSSRKVTEDTKDFTVTNPTSMLETITSTMQTLSFFLTGIAGISLLVGAIGISNTMFMSVMERTRLIGILKSLGTRNSEIMKLFVTESAIIGLMGGLMGIFLGLILVGIISGAGLNLMGMGRMGMSTSVAVVTPQLILFALVFSTIIGVVSGLIPARKASKLQVVVAMRSE